MPRPDWYPDELAYAGPEHLDPAYAGPEHLDPAYIATYDRKAGTDPTEAVAALRALGLDETSVLVDLGAGTGTFTIAAAPHRRRVIAIDVSVAMLAALDTKLGALGLTNVATERAGFLSYDHQGPAADFVYSRNSLHHLSDFWKGIALARIATILKPGGVLLLRDLVYNFDPAEADGAIEAWLSRAVARPEDGWTRAELAEHLYSEYSTYTWLFEPLLERAGFVIQEVEAPPQSPYAAYTCVKR